MKAVSTVLIVLGTFGLAAAVLSLFGTRLRDAGIDIVAYVTSVPITILVSVILILGGVWLRRRTGGHRSDSL
jgi:predicted transporter